MSKLEELIEKFCPNGVEYKALGEIASFFQGIQVPVNEQHYEKEENDVRFLRIIDYADNNEPPRYIKKPDNKYIKKENELIMIRYGTPGKVCIDYEGAIANNMFKINFNIKNVNIKYMYYYLSQQYIYNNLSTSVKSTMPSINFGIVSKVKVAIPPIEVQNEIVRILDNFTELTSELTAELTAELTLRRKQYEYYRDELIQNCDGKEGKLIELLSQPITDGPHTTPELFDEGIPFISATAVYNGKIHLSDAKGFISKEFNEECSKKYKPQKHDIYMVKSGSTTGKVAYVDIDEEFNIWSPLAAMRTSNVITSRYIYYLLQTEDIQNQVITRMSHGSQPNLSMRVIEQFDIKLISLDDQKRIVSILDKFDKLCNDISGKLQAEITAREKQYEYYRDKLLTFKEK